MNFEINKSIEILSKTPTILASLLNGIAEEWIRNNEGENTWSPYNVVGHLIQGEKTDWLVRIKIILGDSTDKTFKPFDRFAQQNADQQTPINVLLEEFELLRNNNLHELKSLQIDEAKLLKKGIHPALGEVTLKELLATWVVHDLGHISQITRVMAKQYATEVGPWEEFLGILKK